MNSPRRAALSVLRAIRRRQRTTAGAIPRHFDTWRVLNPRKSWSRQIWRHDEGMRATQRQRRWSKVTERRLHTLDLQHLCIHSGRVQPFLSAVAEQCPRRHSSVRLCPTRAGHCAQIARKRNWCSDCFHLCRRRPRPPGWRQINNGEPYGAKRTGPRRGRGRCYSKRTQNRAFRGTSHLPHHRECREAQR
jgi:hypothetical protein